MKKLTALLLSLLLVFSLAACGSAGKPAADDQPASNPTEAADGETNTSPDADAKTETGKALALAKVQN